MNPSITVIIPCYNGAKYLPEAVASIRAQSVPVTEILIIDDGSTDDSVEIARGLGEGIRIIQQPNQGQSVARNRGIAEARGEVLAFLDADDFWPPDKLESQVAFLQEDPELQMVLGFMHPFHTTPEGERVMRGEPFFVFVFGCGLFRKSAFDRIGPMDETLRAGEDTDWFFRAWEEKLPLKFQARTGVLYRRHPDSITHDASIKDKGFLRVLKKSLDRRRAAGAGIGTDAPSMAMPDLGIGALYPEHAELMKTIMEQRRS